MKLLFVTGNKGKLKEVEEILGDGWKVINKDIDLEEIQELEGVKVAIRKAKTAYEILESPLIVEDTSLYIKSWNNLPGTFNKWFMKTVGNEGMLKMLEGFHDRRAKAETVFVYENGKTTKIFKGTVDGTISYSIKGENGFGWDRIFIPKGTDKTQAQLSGYEKNRISSRRKALEKLKKYLISI